MHMQICSTHRFRAASSLLFRSRLRSRSGRVERTTGQAPRAAAVDNSVDPVWCGTVLFETSLPEFATTLRLFFEMATLPHHTLTISTYSVPASSLTQDLLV